MKAKLDITTAMKKLPSFLQNPNPEVYNSENYIVVDFETTILDKGSPYEPSNSIVCASYKCGPGHPSGDITPQFVRGSEYQMEELTEAIQASDFMVAHNSKFEYGWLHRCGLPLQDTLAFCTYLAEYILFSNRSNPALLSLDRCLKRRRMESKAGIGKKLLAAGVCPSTWPDRWLIPYSLQDVVAGEKLFLHQRRVMAARGLLGVALTRNILTPVLVDIEANGMHLDPERAPKLQRDYNAELVVIREQIDKITGGANPASPKQMREVLYETLKFPLPKDHKFYGKPDKDGNPVPSSGADLIATLVPRNKKQKEFIRLKKEFGRVNAALTKCLNKFTDCIRETDDNILTARMNQAITKTQRLSSTGKNYGAQFQNFPRIFKPLFSARHEGWYIGEVDQAQLEYRVAVFLGDDAAGRQDISSKVDAHGYTASIIFEHDWKTLPKDDPKRKSIRTASKAHTFKPLFGGQSGTRAEKRYYQAFQEKHQGITRAQNKWKIQAVNTGKVVSVTGLTFYFPGTKVLEDGYITNSTNICNYPVQSLATADIVPIGVVYQWHLMRVNHLESFLVNTIHDSTIGEVHPEEREQYQAIAEHAHVSCVYNYLQEVYGIDFDVPLEVETDFNLHWSDSPEWQEKYL
jgi:DNA polymerase I-like protein with 3'-5' exonuclease and polymerase domains